LETESQQPQLPKLRVTYWNGHCWHFFGRLECLPYANVRLAV